MAQAKFIFACVFLVLIFSQEFQSTEGRHLKSRKKNKHPKLQTLSKNIENETRKIAEHVSVLHGITASDTKNASGSLPAPPSQAVDESPAAVGHSEGLKPTGRGHSPGVGHSVSAPLSQVQDKSAGSPPSGHVDDFGPTAPGHSPGVGHFLSASSQVEDESGHVDDFRPTTPGHSPGAGHSLGN